MSLTVNHSDLEILIRQMVIMRIMFNKCYIFLSCIYFYRDLHTFLYYIYIEHLIVSYNVYNDDIFKGGKSALKDILQYNTASHTWEEVGQMKEARSLHAVAVLEDVSRCRE